MSGQSTRPAPSRFALWGSVLFTLSFAARTVAAVNGDGSRWDVAITGFGLGLFLAAMSFNIEALRRSRREE